MNPLVTQEVLDKALKNLAKLSKAWKDGVCAGETLRMDGTPLLSGHGACHSWLTFSYDNICFSGGCYDSFKPYKKEAQNFLTLTCHNTRRSSAKPEATKGVLVWLAEKSPMKDFIVAYNDDGAIILCGPDGANVQQAMWICKVLRYSTEGGKALDVWWKLYQDGVDPMLAIIVATYVRTVKGATFGYTGQDGHSCVFRDGSTNIAQAMRGEFNPKPTATSEVFCKNPDGVELARQLQTLTQKELRDDGWGGKTYGDTRDANEFSAAVRKWQDTIKL